MSGYTPGPWRWEVHPNQHSVQLCGGRPQYDLTVMTCERWGMQGAAPSFLKPMGGSSIPLITRADAFMVPIAGREHHADWLQTIDNPDAYLIAAAPDLLEAAKLAESVLSHMAKVLDYHPEGGTAVPKLQAAIAKAEGR